MGVNRGRQAVTRQDRDSAFVARAVSLFYLTVRFIYQAGKALIFLMRYRKPIAPGNGETQVRRRNLRALKNVPSCPIPVSGSGRGIMHFSRVVAMFALVALCAVMVPVSDLRGEDCEEAMQWYREGLLLHDDSEREAAYYRKAIGLCPDFFEAHNRLGEVYASWGEYELAVQEFEQAVRNSTYAEAHNNLGKAYRMQGRYDLARKAFIQAIKIRPNFREASNQLKYVEKRLGFYDYTMEDPPDTVQLIPIPVFSRIPGMTLPKGAFLTDLQYKYWRQEADLEEVGTGRPPGLGPGKREADVHVWILGIRYGLTDNFTIGVIPKYFYRELDLDVGVQGIDPELSVQGIGDTVFLTKYRLWGRRRVHLAAYNLLSIPTGDEDAEDEDEGVARRTPLGSGGFDFSPGLALTAYAEPFTFHANVWYWFGKRQGGDEFHFDLGVTLPRLYDFLPVFEMNYRWVDSTERKQLIQTQLGRPPWSGPPGSPPFSPETEEIKIREDGGHTLFLSPGLQYFITKNLKAEIGLQVPVVRPDDGWAENVIVHVGLMRYFF